MTGTFYRNPGPGLPPFVKPGDKVNKGQVLCIIEAMKLMNEIEADQAGTVVEILLIEDGKPVGVGQASSLCRCYPAKAVHV
ncbi:biotin carboxyl carrier protein of acetyl-CoA carboxylase 2, chloroplastic-like [Zingiber officinale]|uniref:biotin carboxyl carrier protein of acetyl-CoA carboxylase 2, chloroplastic-like n=1 Tax=Zingiber officinale TaxID=94328 RepID=UPI001C4DBC66|nr:biotin carboxyl carrier protein of acetyl-CoA carboxylase 2, chloroplastic-like [Zingiber officinale]